MKLAPAAARNVHMGAKSPRLGFLIHGSDCYFASDKSNYIHRYNTRKVSQGEGMLNLKGNVQMFNIQSRVYSSRIMVGKKSGKIYHCQLV